MQDCKRTEFLQTLQGSTLGQQDKSHIEEANPSQALKVSVCSIYCMEPLVSLPGQLFFLNAWPSFLYYHTALRLLALQGAACGGDALVSLLQGKLGAPLRGVAGARGVGVGISSLLLALALLRLDKCNTRGVRTLSRVTSVSCRGRN